MKKKIIHLLPNAHIDPVWMWDYRDGLTEGVRTCRTILKLMQEYPQLTFIRGESAIYEHIELRDPETFAGIREMVKAGRWEIVGGQYIQPDDNMPSSRTVLKQFEIGKQYFREKFGIEIETGWLADAFGHSRGTPELFSFAGIKRFAFCRPQEWICPIGNPVFRWRGQGGSSLLCCRMPAGAYASERKDNRDMYPTVILTEMLEKLTGNPMINIPLAFGLGDHGGGPTRQHIDDLMRYQEKHPELEIKYSTLRAYFDAVETEYQAENREIPEFSGEINFCQRGCYSSTMKFKRTYRRAENQLTRCAKVSALTNDRSDLTSAEKGLCFNAFHDILPGTSIERAMREQTEWLGGVIQAGRHAEFMALTKLGCQLDTTVAPPREYNLPEAVPYVVFNPHAQARKVLLDIDFELDNRPIWDYELCNGKVPVEVRNHRKELVYFQTEDPESHALKDIPPWRKRVLFFAELPAFGYQVFTLGYQPQPEVAPEIPSAEHTWLKDSQIGNGFYTVTAQCGQSEIIIQQQDKVIPLKLELYHDFTGSWGDMSEKPENSHYPDLAEVWQITRIRPVEAGPLRSRLWVELSGKKSRIELVFSLVSGQQQLDISARISWLDRGKRLKLQMPKGDFVDYDVPGGIMRRGESASVPGGRYAKVSSDPGYIFYSDTVYGFEHENGCFSAVLARGCRFSTDELCREDEHIEHPVADHGELLMNFIISPFDAPAERIAENLEQPPIVWLEATHSGVSRNGALARALPEALKVIDMSSSGMILQNRTNQTVNWLDQDFPPWKIIRIPVSGIKTDLGLTF